MWQVRRVRRRALPHHDAEADRVHDARRGVPAVKLVVVAPGSDDRADGEREREAS